MYYIGIDLGTSAVKLLLMDETGSIANIVSREYPIAFPHPGWSEQDPADRWAAVSAIFPWAHRARCSSPAIRSASTSRTPCTASPTRTEGII